MSESSKGNQNSVSEYRLVMENITVKYGDFTANDHVDLAVKPGQIMSLLGENGAGKTTLMKVLAGLLTPQSGRIFIDGKETEIPTPLDSQRLGIGMVHQHFMLIPKLTVAQNICIGLKSVGYPFPNIKRVEAELRDISQKYNLRVDPSAVVSSLSIGEQQRAEILKVLYRGAKILILDEPTSILTPQETEGLFEIIKYLTAQGNSVIFISHKLKEVMTISDWITVLRQGKVTAGISKKEITEHELAVLMVGREFQSEREKPPVSREAAEVLRLEGLSYVDDRKLKVVNGIDLTVKAGEIHSIAGVDGNGQLELANLIAGIFKPSEGRMILGGKDVTKASPGERIGNGLAHIPSDRHRYGMILDSSLEENLILENNSSEPISKNGFIDQTAVKEFSERLIREYDVRCETTKQKGATLSGGNQQKLVLARELSRDPKFILAVQPAHGLDVGATEFVHDKLIEQRNRGSAVLLISTELDEVFELSDRISVIYNGKISATMDRSEADRGKIGMLMTGKTYE